MINLAPQQDAAIKKLADWYKAGVHRKRPFFVLNGSAGTGKTTIAKLLPELVVEQEGAVAYAAFTGKAALQLRRKGCDGATTLHRLLYQPKEKNRETLRQLTESLRATLLEDPTAASERAERLKREIHEERRRLAKPSWDVITPKLIEDGFKLLVVDESSMLSDQLVRDISRIGLPVVYLGDPFQLPPVRGCSPLDDSEPDVMLTEVHRQALESPILRAAIALRNKQLPDPSDNSDGFKILSPTEAGYEAYADTDQVLCGRNATRRLLNKKLRDKLVERRQLTQTQLPVSVGDKVVFLRNDHDEGVFNGMTATLTGVTDGGRDNPDGLIIDGQSDDVTVHSYEAWAGVLEGEDMLDAPRNTQVIDLSYALTVHKAQGSEWDRVLVHLEPVGHGNDALRWLYTAVTRASKQCIIVDKNRG